VESGHLNVKVNGERMNSYTTTRNLRVTDGDRVSEETLYLV